MRPSRLVLTLAAGALAWGTPMTGQGYRVRLDARYQGVSYRGWQLDSIPADEAQVSGDGSYYTSDGYAVRCPGGATYCTYYRAGPTL